MQAGAEAASWGGKRLGLSRRMGGNRCLCRPFDQDSPQARRSFQVVEVNGIDYLLHAGAVSGEGSEHLAMSCVEVTAA